MVAADPAVLLLGVGGALVLAWLLVPRIRKLRRRLSAIRAHSQRHGGRATANEFVLTRRNALRVGAAALGAGAILRYDLVARVGETAESGLANYSGGYPNTASENRPSKESWREQSFGPLSENFKRVEWHDDGDLTIVFREEHNATHWEISHVSGPPRVSHGTLPNYGGSERVDFMKDFKETIQQSRSDTYPSREFALHSKVMTKLEPTSTVTFRVPQEIARDSWFSV